ncbi:hypothetical protein CDD82_7960 [Ophiocordyceps australis]|uniref:3-oxo-5-alpha-steroid 4-dehydrogenase C-terminal domain-containing protein n=1 Tax=Ophiocordyceps australis TaxID=1399860 RepID=A0A2C5ZPI7_9HYPO|nr:hypothetical protein CDD82_7960 [Ophiocordyceps australis]
MEQHWIPPSEEHYETLLRVWQVSYPLLGSLQWILKWYGMGKTSTASRLNLPGRVAWATMEAPGFVTLLYTMRGVAALRGVTELPWQNRVLAGLFTIHYSYRALLFPMLQPSMAPIHPLVWSLALSFQLFNGLCLGSWLGGHGGGPVTQAEWSTQTPLWQFALGLAIFYAGLGSNFFHDEQLREIRRRAQGKNGDKRESSRGALGEKKRHYEIPQAGLFRYMLYPHYLCEWIEWTGFLIAAGWSCKPAWAFLVNEVCSMLPRAVRGKAWYVERFGSPRVGHKWTIVPGLV